MPFVDEDRCVAAPQRGDWVGPDGCGLAVDPESKRRSRLPGGGGGLPGGAGAGDEHHGMVLEHLGEDPVGKPGQVVDAVHGDRLVFLHAVD